MTSSSNPHGFLPPQGYDNFTPPPPYLGANTGSSDPSNELFHQRLLLRPPVDCNRPNPKPRIQRKPEARAGDAIPPCIECGKRFSSSKVLYGHMRCHPERPYRGMKPRTHLGRLLLGSTSRESKFTDDEYEVAKSLIILANGPPLVSRDMDAIEATRSSPSSYRFECPSCFKVFGPHQALARHLTGHSKDKARLTTERCGGGEEMGSSDSVRNKRAREEEAMVYGSGHKCNVCYRAFSTGQALWGHKRCHRERGEEHAGSCSSINCYVWDLNLPPPLEANEGPSPNPSPVLDLKLGS